VPNVHEISLSTSEIKLFPVSENGWPRAAILEFYNTNPNPPRCSISNAMHGAVEYDVRLQSTNRCFDKYISQYKAYCA